MFLGRPPAVLNFFGLLSGEQLDGREPRELTDLARGGGLGPRSRALRRGGEAVRAAERGQPQQAPGSG